VKGTDKEKFLEIYEKEMKREKLIPLTEDFYKNVLSSIPKLDEELRDEIKRLESDAIKEMIIEMFLCRLIKIIKIMLDSKEINLSQLTQEEIEVVKKIEEIIARLRRSKRRVIEKALPQNILVVFVKTYPPFLASDRKMYGPFSVGDIAYLPRVDVSDLRKKGVVTIIKE